MERERPRPPPLDLLDPGRLLDGPLVLVEELDRALRRLDEALREFDSRILSRPPELLVPRERGSVAMSPSYPGQTVTDYCLECIERHYAKAHGLLEEAERFSLKYGKITPEAREKIRRAVEELVTSEDDLGVYVEDEEFRRALDEIKVMLRDVRKFMWAKGLTTVSESLDDLRAAKDMVKRLLDKAYEVAERYRRKYGGCSYCEQLAREVSEKFGVSESEVLEAIYGVASDDKERVAESLEKLRKMGVLEYVFRRVEEVLREMGGGR